MILFLHHRYRTTGGEERVVADLRWLAEEHLGERTALLERDSAELGKAAAAREAGVRTVLHLHNYRLVCAVGTCFTRGADCTRCHGRDTAPGVRLNCRGTGPEALVYGASLALWQRRIVAHADAVVVPSQAAAARLRELGAPLPEHVHVVGHVVRSLAAAPAGGARHALVASRLAPEKGVDIAIAACRQAGIPL